MAPSAGEVDEGLAAVDEALQRAERNEELWCMPEVLRIKGELQLLQSEAHAAVAEDSFLRSLDWARRQRALSWELRAAMSLARLWRDQGQRREAFDLLAAVHGRFTEGFRTSDLQTAKRLLDDLALTANFDPVSIHIDRPRPRRAHKLCSPHHD